MASFHGKRGAKGQERCRAFGDEAALFHDDDRVFFVRLSAVLPGGNRVEDDLPQEQMDAFYPAGCRVSGKRAAKRFFIGDRICEGR